MADYITKNFLPAKIHIKEQPAVFERFGARWTPTLLVLDSDGAERHRLALGRSGDDVVVVRRMPPAVLCVWVGYCGFLVARARYARRFGVVEV